MTQNEENEKEIDYNHAKSDKTTEAQHQWKTGKGINLKDVDKILGKIPINNKDTGHQNKFEGYEVNYPFPRIVSTGCCNNSVYDEDSAAYKSCNQQQQWKTNKDYSYDVFHVDSKVPKNGRGSEETSGNDSVTPAVRKPQQQLNENEPVTRNAQQHLNKNEDIKEDIYTSLSNTPNEIYNPNVYEVWKKAADFRKLQT